jgi:O-antigen/teichoic acid export membrane protein
MGLKKLGWNVGATMLCQIATAILTLGVSVLVARSLGPTGNGIYNLALLIPTTLSTLWNFGMVAANSYYVGAKKVAVPTALWTTIVASVFFSALGFALMVPILYLFSHRLFPGVPLNYLWWMLLIFPISLFQLTLASLFLGMQTFKPFNLAMVITPAANLLAAILLILVLKMSVPGAIAAFATGQLASLILTYAYLHPHTRAEKAQHDLVRYAKESLSYGYKAHLSNIIGFINYRVDVYLVGIMMNPTTLGVYAISVQIAERFWMLSYSVSGVILPRLSELHSDEHTRNSLTPLISRWVLYLTMAMVLMVVLVGKFLIVAFFGVKYAEAYNLILWLIPGILMCAFARVLSGDIAARGRIEINLYITSMVVVVNIVANLLLIPRMGAYGGALATSIAYSLDAIIRMTYYAHLSGNPWHSPFFPAREDLVLLKKVLGMVKGRLRRAS